MEQWAVIFGGFVIGLLGGGGAVFLFRLRVEKRALAARDEIIAQTRADHAQARERLARIEAAREAEAEAAKEKVALLEAARDRLAESFKSLSAEALERNNRTFLDLARATMEKYQSGAKADLDKRQVAIDQLVQPVGKALKDFNEQINALEKSRATAFSSLGEQIRTLNEVQLRLSRQTGSLVQALRAPQVRGRWGELQLRRTVELAGMVAYCDFVEQASVETGEGTRQRPDMLIRLPNERQIVVDSKAPLAAYLDSLEKEEPAERAVHLQHHARQLREHVRSLSAKSYWTQFDDTPEFVVLFLPGETFFSAALEADPELINYGADNQVIIATPTTLIALLKAVAYGWRQEAVAREAKQISALGVEIYDRMGVLANHFATLGKSLERSVEAYNQTVSSVERRVLVTARKFRDLESADGKEIPTLEPIEKRPKAPSIEG